MSRTSPPQTAFQIRLRPRAAGLLVFMSEQKRRRPQDQAAWLVELAVEAWAAEQGYEGVAPEPTQEEEEWASTPALTTT